MRTKWTELKFYSGLIKQDIVVCDSCYSVKTFITIHQRHQTHTRDNDHVSVNKVSNFIGTYTIYCTPTDSRQEEII